MRKHSIAALVAVLCCIPASAFAGRIFGDIKLDGKPVPAGVTMRVTRAGEGGKAVGVDTTTTDKFGSYKVLVKDDGKCTLIVDYEKQSASLDVFSYKEATRYDLILEKKDGKLSLRRK